MVALLRYIAVEPEARLREEATRAVLASLQFELAITREVANPFGYARQYVRDLGQGKRSSFFLEPRTRFVLKIPKNPKRAARHRDEVEAAVRLKHPGIAHFDYYGVGEPTFLVTRFYPRGNLKREHVEHLSLSRS